MRFEKAALVRLFSIGVSDIFIFQFSIYGDNIYLRLQ
jgi:hypothetical protein